jgi:HlyD family secretion protein
MLAVVALAALTIASPVVEFSRAAASQTAASANADVKTAASPDNTIRLHGLVEPIRSRLVTAPRITGGGPAGGTPAPQLVIVCLTKAGTMVRKGDLLVEFDRTSQLKNARDREAEYRDILAQIDKKQAEQIIARAARQTGRKIAENAVRRAELDLVGVEMLAKITAEKNQQVLEETRAKLAQLRKTNELHERAAAADLRILEIQRDRTKNAWDHAATNATRMRIVSPLNGLVVLRFVFKGGTMAEMQEGEEVRPGIPILEVVDPTAMRVRAAVNQADVASLAPGMKVRITLESYPSRTFDGRLENLSPVATASSMSARVRTFAAVFSVEGTDEHVLPDLAAAIEVQPAAAEGP